MSDAEGGRENRLVLRGGSALATRSAGLARRGLDLLRHPAWEVFDVGEQDFSAVFSVSPTGLVATGGRPGPPREHVVVITSPYAAASVRVSAPGTGDPPQAETPMSYAWSPDGRYLLTGSGDHECALRLFDLATSTFVRTLGWHRDELYNLAWSAQGQYLASASSIYPPFLRLWRAGDWRTIEDSYSAAGIEEVGSVSEVNGIPAQAFDESLREWRGLYGFRSIEFSPVGKYLAMAGLRKEGREGGAFLAIFQVPTLRELFHIPITGSWDQHPRQVSWMPAFSDETGAGCLVYATNEGRMWRVYFEGEAHEVTELPVKARMCACNPCAPICAFAWPGYGDKSTPQAVSIYSFHSEQVVDAYEAPNGVADLRWNTQGTELYVLQRRGPLLVYRPDLEVERRRPRQWVVRRILAMAKPARRKDPGYRAAYAKVAQEIADNVNRKVTKDPDSPKK